MRSVLSLALLALPVLLQPKTAGAVIAAPPTQTTYYFSGTCSDCQKDVPGRQALAELTLSNYNLGDNITRSNFVSFRYDGTDLVPGFTFNSENSAAVLGSIDTPIPGTENFTIYGYVGPMREQFTTSKGGSWNVTINFISSDEGTTHVWDATPAATAVPEPMSVALLGAGVLGIAVARRRA